MGSDHQRNDKLLHHLAQHALRRDESGVGGRVRGLGKGTRRDRDHGQCGRAGRPDRHTLPQTESEMDPAKMLKPEVMGPPIAWLCTSKADGVTGQRFIGGKWDPAMSDADAVAEAGSSAGWPDLAAATVIWPD